MNHVVPMPVRTRAQVADVGCNVGPRGGFGRNIMDTAEGEIVLEGPSVCLNSRAGQAKIALDRQPGASQRHHRNLWIALPLDRCHTSSFLAVPLSNLDMALPIRHSRL